MISKKKNKKLLILSSLALLKISRSQILSPNRDVVVKSVDILLFRLFANWLRTLVNRFVNCHSWNFCNLKSIEDRNTDNSNRRISLLTKIMLGFRDISEKVLIVPKRVL